jgi:hypothetical protein
MKIQPDTPLEPTWLRPSRPIVGGRRPPRIRVGGRLERWIGRDLAERSILVDLLPMSVSTPGLATRRFLESLSVGEQEQYNASGAYSTVRGLQRLDWYHVGSPKMTFVLGHHLFCQLDGMLKPLDVFLFLSVSVIHSESHTTGCSPRHIEQDMMTGKAGVIVNCNNKWGELLMKVDGVMRSYHESFNCYKRLVWACVGAVYI